MMAADLTPGTHMTGLLMREDHGLLFDQIPVVRQIGRVFHDGVLVRIDVTWEGGGGCSYAPDADVRTLAEAEVA